MASDFHRLEAVLDSLVTHRIWLAVMQDRGKRSADLGVLMNQNSAAICAALGGYENGGALSAINASVRQASEAIRENDDDSPR